MKWRLPNLRRSTRKSGLLRKRSKWHEALIAPRSDFSPERLEQLEQVEQRLGYSFIDRALLQRALTHRSFLHDAGRSADGEQLDYEALEFFGDTVLDLVIGEELLLSQPFSREGELSKLKAHLVSSRQLSEMSSRLELGRYLLLSRGEERSGGRKKDAILADIFESVTAAIYLDRGLEAARQFVLTQFAPVLREIQAERFEVRDFKSALQEYLHSIGRSEPSYRIIEESGPDHRKEFGVEVVSEGRRLAVGQGRSKKQAEQRAAQLALDHFGS